LGSILYFHRLHQFTTHPSDAQIVQKAHRIIIQKSAVSILSLPHEVFFLLPIEGL